MHCPLLSLPLVFKTTLGTIPAGVPYLTVDPSIVRGWEDKLASEPRVLRIGLNWAGNPFPPSNRKRTIGLASMASLAAVDRIRFYSLQKGEAPREDRPLGLEVMDWSAEQKAFADSAALISTLDLVVTCDTSVAHVAGALGVPVWVLLPFAAEWRWLRGRDTSPWYPTMRLFRQSRPGDWNAPMDMVPEELERLSRPEYPITIPPTGSSAAGRMED